MQIKKIISWECDENCYLVSEGKAGILIDPGFSGDDITDACKGYDIEYIFLTHSHFDHVKSAAEIKEKTGAKIVSSKKCSENMGDNIKNVSYLFGEDETFAPADIIVGDNEVIKTSFCDVKCIFTPGHTDCSVSFVIEDHVFTGDTIFRMSVGRWDLPTGNFSELEKSVKERIFTLPDNFTIHSGHGADSSVGFEKANNPYVK